MRAFTCAVIISGVSTKVDGGLCLRLTTPELDPQEKAAVFELQNCELKMLLQQEGENETKFTEVKGQFDTKTPSQRLRAVLYVLWKGVDGTGDFEMFYRRRMDSIIDKIKEKFPKEEQ
jgi:hypothetical protein